jgi:hypothetical protein
MNPVHHRQSLSPNGQTVLPVRCAKTVQFNVLITRKRIKTTSGPSLCRQRISGERALRTANALFGQRGPSSPQVRTSKTKGNKWYQSAQSVIFHYCHPRANISGRTPMIFMLRGNVWGIIAKLRRALQNAIPMGYEDATGFHRIEERPASDQKTEG